MPTKNENSGQIFYQAENGELKPIGETIELSAETEDISDYDCAEYFKDVEMTFELTEEGKRQITEFMKPYLKAFDDIDKLLKRTFWCNNWRKMHHLPLIRRKGKRK